MTRPTQPSPDATACEFTGTRRYQVRRQLGEGAMGIVYEAFDRERDALVALKFLRRANPAGIYRFKREFRALADVSHRNLVDLHELVSVGDDWFFTMELIDGASFLDHVRSIWSGEAANADRDQGAAPPPRAPAGADHIDDCATATATATTDTAITPNSLLAEAASSRAADEVPVGPRVADIPTAPEHFAQLRTCMAQLAQGVNALHEAGQLHRDIKPSNILVDGDGRVVLVDFGVAFQLSESGPGRDDRIAGTPVYMAPEQMLGDPLDESSDWYAVGVVLFEALTGRRPFHSTAEDIRAAKNSCDAPSPADYSDQVPDDLNELCTNLLERLPGSRPSGAAILAQLCPAHDNQRDGSSRPAAVLMRSPVSEITLVGREPYLDRIHEHFEHTRSGRASSLLITGPSGVGKSALMHHAVGQLEQRHAAVVLEGRCYERESVPYKALDHLVDELCQRLIGRSAPALRTLLPDGFAALAQLFPVLRRLGSTATELVHPDLQEQRRRAFRALRELLRALTRESPLVLCIDDAQWGDLDSAMAMAGVLRGDDAPPLLLLITCRSEEAARSAFLSALVPELPELGQLEVAPMSQSEARRLAHSLLTRSAEFAANSAAEEANVIAEEARGNPLFVVELARSALASGARPRQRSRGDRVSLDQLICDRVDQLSEPTRRLLQVVAVAARPIAQGATRVAAELGDDGRRALAELRAGRLVRSSGVHDQHQVAVYHDRIGAAVLASLSPEARSSCHRRLALVLEASEHADPEVLAMHFDGAGNSARAGHYEALAGDAASAALAFDRAADHYQRALALSELTTSEESELRGRLADALACAGRGADAGRTYLAALPGATPERALELRRQSAEQLLTSGHIEEGLGALKEALRAVNLRFPDTSLLGLVRIALKRSWLRLRGTWFRARARKEIAPEQLRKLDIYWTAVAGFGYCDLLRAVDFLTSFQLLAYRTGELHRVVCALNSELVFAGGAGHRARRRTARLRDQTFELANRCPDPHARGLTLACAAYRSYPLGEFAKALDYAERATRVLRQHCTGVTWELGLSEMVQMWSLYYLGRTGEMSQRLPVLLRDARERSDWFMAANMCTTILNINWLLEDDVDEARRVCREAMKHWPTDMGILLQHFWEVMALGQADLYAGEGRAAWELVDERWRAMRWSTVMQLHIARIEFINLRSRCALAAASETDSTSERRRLLAIARRTARGVAGKKSAITAPLAALLRAGIAACAGKPERALDALVVAEGGFDRASMALHAACARYRRGQLLGGDRGDAMVAEASQLLRDESVANPGRMVAMHAPGFDRETR